MASSTTELLQRTKAFLLLRYTLIAATAYLILVEGEFSTPPLGVVLAITAALLSNVLATLVPARIASSSGFGLAVIVADTAWITAALVASGRFNAEFFYLYFFVLLLAAIGENLSLIAVGSVVVCCAYLYALSVTGSGWSLWRSPSVIRIPFLFTAAAFYGYLVDRTRHEQRVAAEAESAASAKNIFLATVSHELRTPVTGIIGWAQLLLDTPLSAEQREYAEGVHRLGDSLVSIIGDFLDFTKIEARRIELETTAFTPRAVVEETVELLAGPAQRKGVEVAYRVDPAVPRALRGDPGRLRQVLLNLVGNALKFTVGLLREPSPAEGPASRPDLPGLHVLVIDDNDTSRAFLEEQLRAWGLRSDGASDGRSALPRLRAALEAGDPYALVLLDADMPDLSGRQLVHAIHAAPALSRTPLVLLTAIGEKDPHPPGVVGTLTKPVREARLAECLASVAGRLSPRVTPLLSAGSSARRLPRAAGS